MASLVTIAIALSVAYGVLFGAFLAISCAIRREDKVGTLTGHANGLPAGEHVPASNG